jgi:hypothetical protein
MQDLEFERAELPGPRLCSRPVCQNSELQQIINGGAGGMPPAGLLATPG